MTQSFGKPRLLIFIGSLRAGGKERRLTELLTYLKADDRFEILVVMTKNEIHYCEFYALGIPYTVIKKRWKRNDPGVFLEFYQICRRFDPDIIHTWGRMQSLYAVPVVVGQRRFLVNSQITGAPTRISRWAASRIIDMINFRFSHVVLANSKAGLETYGPPAVKQRLIYNGINLSRFLDLPPTAEVKRKYGINTSFAVVMIASFTPAKDYSLFFDIAKKVTGIREDISFIGAGGYSGNDSEYRRMVALSSGYPRIIFHGEIRDVEALVNACTIGVLFSTNGEGLSNAILEYMALGKPVIATRSGGTAELVSSGENGYLVNNQDPDEIVEKIIELVSDPLKAAAFGEFSKKRIIESFSVDGMGRAFTEVYGQVLSREKPGRPASYPVITNNA